MHADPPETETRQRSVTLAATCRRCLPLAFIEIDERPSTWQLSLNLPRRRAYSAVKLGL